MILAHVDYAFRNTSAEGSEVAGIPLELYIRHAVYDAVETLFKERKDFAFTTAILICCNNIIFRLFIQNLHHLANDLRSLLQISINEGDIIAAGVFHTGVNTGLFTKITGEGNDLYRTFLLAEDLFQVMERSVLAAVIDKNDLVVISAAFERGNYGFLKSGYIFCFVITRNDKGKLQSYHRLKKGLFADIIYCVDRIVNFGFGMNTKRTL